MILFSSEIFVVLFLWLRHLLVTLLTAIVLKGVPALQTKISICAISKSYKHCLKNCTIWGKISFDET